MNLEKVKTIVAIDPGKTGAIVYVRNKQITTQKMPSSLADIDLFLKGIASYGPMLVFIEKQILRPSDPPERRHAISKLVKHYNQMLASMMIAEIDYIEVMPKSWMSYLGLVRKHEEYKDRKVRLGNAANEYFYKLTKVYKWNADALLILRFALLKKDHHPMWIHEQLEKETKGLF